MIQYLHDLTPLFQSTNILLLVVTALYTTARCNRIERELHKLQASQSSHHDGMGAD